MGRSRPPIAATEDEPGNRSKRRRIALGADNLDAGATGSNDGKKALYHCNYCSKDISGTIRIKCAKCPDFDLCVECFSVGAEVTPHKCNHPYRVIDNLSFPLIHPDWNADEEILLLEGVEMYGLGNWAEVSEHIATKTKGQCYDHYMSAYMNSPYSPIPDMTHVQGKSKSELLSMAKTQLEGKKGVESEGDGKFLVLKANTASTTSTGVGTECDEGDVKPLETKATIANSSAGTQEAGQSNRSIGGKKPKPLLEDSKDGATVLDQSGYNPKRQEFDPEYDNEAEVPLAEMEFKDNDTETDHELKIRMLHIYLSRLDERKRRKEFILERELLDVKRQLAAEKRMSKEEHELYQRARVFLRYHSSDDHEALLAGLISERRIRQRIAELQEYRAAGCRTLAEAEQYKIEKRKREEAKLLKSRESTVYLSAGKGMQRSNRNIGRDKADGEVDPSNNLAENQRIAIPCTMPSAAGKGPIKTLLQWDLTGLPGTDFLSSVEQNLCGQNRLIPAHYLRIKEVLMLENLKSGHVKRLDAHRLFKVDRNKIDKVYDLLVEMGWIQGEEIITS